MNIEARVRRLEAVPRPATAAYVAKRTAELEAELAELGLVVKLSGKDGGPIDLKRPFACLDLAQLKTLMRAVRATAGGQDSLRLSALPELPALSRLI